MEDFAGQEVQRSGTSAANSNFDFMDRNLLESFAESFLDSSYHFPMAPYPLAPLTHIPSLGHAVPLMPPIPIIRPSQGAFQTLSNLEAMDMKMHSEMFPLGSSLLQMPASFDLERDEDPLPMGSGGAVNSAAKERRRERNKVLARKTRIKKKAEMEAMGDRVLALMVENERLRGVIQQNLPTVSAETLLSRDMNLPESIVVMVKQLLRNHEKAEMNEISIKQRSFCLVNPSAHDYPIVYTSPGFIQLTGYSREETIGKNCRFLQGPDTDASEVAVMKQALMEQKDVTVVLLNYHKNGTPFWNKIGLAHLRDLNGKVSFVVGLQSPCGPHCIRTRLARRKTFTSLTQRSSLERKQPHEDRLSAEDLDSSALERHEANNEKSGSVGEKRERSEGSTTTEPSDPSESGDSKNE